MNVKSYLLMFALFLFLSLNFASSGHAQAVRTDPVALGIVKSSGDSVPQLHAIKSRWVLNKNWYEIEIPKVNYFWLRYVTVVTPVTDGVIPSTGSVNGKLIVKLTDRNGHLVKGDFGFVTFPLRPVIK